MIGIRFQVDHACDRVVVFEIKLVLSIYLSIYLHLLRKKKLSIAYACTAL